MMQLSRPAGCLSDLTLDSWSSGELGASASDRVDAHVAKCERCRKRHADLESVRADFYAAAPSFDALRLRAGKTKHRRQPVLLGGGLALLLSAAAAWLFMPGVTPMTRPKGGPSLGYFVKRGDLVFQGEHDSTLHPGDLVRFTYSSGAPRYLALFSRDAQSSTLYFPTGDRAAPVQSDSDVGLDFSIELDEVLGDEQVWSLFCSESIELNPLLQTLRETGHLPVPSGCQELTLTLHKVARP